MDAFSVVLKEPLYVFVTYYFIALESYLIQVTGVKK